MRLSDVSGPRKKKRRYGCLGDIVIPRNPINSCIRYIRFSRVELGMLIYIHIYCLQKFLPAELQPTRDECPGSVLYAYCRRKKGKKQYIYVEKSKIYEKYINIKIYAFFSPSFPSSSCSEWTGSGRGADQDIKTVLCSRASRKVGRQAGRQVRSVGVGI